MEKKMPDDGPDVVFTVKSPTLRKLPPPARMQLRSVQNRAVMLEEVHKRGSAMQHDAFVRAAKHASQTVQELEHNDSVASRLGPEAVSYLQTLKLNALALQFSQANEYAAIVAEWMRDSWETVMGMPAASFASPTFSEKVDAFLRGSNAELELRPGAPALSFGQQLRQLLAGDVVSRIAVNYDKKEMLARGERLDEKRHQQASEADEQALLDRMSALEAELDAAEFVKSDPALLVGERSEVVEDLDRQLARILREKGHSAEEPEESEPIVLPRIARAR